MQVMPVSSYNGSEQLATQRLTISEEDPDDATDNKAQDMGEAAAWPLGVLSHQQGEHDRGAEMIDRAIALNPSVATYHANMAEVFRTLGRLDRAEDCCRTALHLQSDYPEAANSLGLILLRAGTDRRGRRAVWFGTSAPARFCCGLQ